MSHFKNIRKSIRITKVIGFKCAVKFLLAHYSPKDFTLMTRFGRPVVIRGQTSDLNVFYDIFRRNPFGRISHEHFDVIIDAGANAGFSTLYFALNSPHAKVIAIEPEKKNFDLLVKNIQGTKNVTAHNKCLWFRNEVLQLENPGEQSWEFRFSGRNSHESAGGVESVTLKELVAGFSTQKVLVKIDIEGAEKEVFEHGADWLEKVDCVLVEIHGCWKQVFDALVPYDYNAEVIGEYILLRLKK